MNYLNSLQFLVDDFSVRSQNIQFDCFVAQENLTGPLAPLQKSWPSQLTKNNNLSAIYFQLCVHSDRFTARKLTIRSSLAIVVRPNINKYI